ncbi:MFS general substrate transporter [Cenococcum geophilum 1.58]|uniref:MFS general substrate transporter n=1 Tax=Cenococcum geophilum 1.58 TaxID=794803 RepID=UPI00358E0A40|nr:MFS general substrate transporter [Cenococcum geophilum 1.58]
MDRHGYNIENAENLPPTAATTTVAADNDVTRSRSEQAQRLLLKMDFTIVPMLACSFFIAYLDRNNIGNARVMGMQKDLHLTDKQFFNCLSMFYVGYLTFMLPSNLAMRVISPPKMIGTAIIFFGICTLCLAATKKYAAILVLRVLNGSGQAFVQVAFLYFSIWYKRSEVATRAAMYYTPATISGCLSGLIAYGVDKNLRDTSKLLSWQWLFITEGAPSLVVGVFLFFFLPPFPEQLKKANWIFNREEIKIAVQRTIEANNQPNARIVRKQIWAGLRDPKAYFTAVIHGAVVLGITSINCFLPTFILAFGFGPLETQLFSMIPYGVATVSLVTVCLLSDRVNSKGPVLLLCLATSGIGYIILMATTNKVALIAGACLVTLGIFPGGILNVAWININHGGYTKRSTAWAMAQVTGNACGIVGTQVYRDPPRFLAGHGTLLGSLVLAIGATVTNYLWMKTANRKKEESVMKWRNEGRENPNRNKTYEELLDYHPDFKYIL